MAKDENKITKEFGDRIELRDKLYDTVKELLLSTTEDQFKELNIKPVENYKGEYGTEEKFGAGAEEGKYNIRLIGKTKSFIEKDIIFGAKRTQSIITLDLVSNMGKIHYDTTERSMGRYNVNGPLIITSSISIDMDNKDFKKEIEKFLTEIAKQEVYYISETKLGIEDKLETHTDSITENTEMSGLSLKKLFFGSFDDTEKAFEEFVNESKKKVEKGEENLLVDDKEDEEEDKEEKGVSEVTTAGAIGAPGTVGPFQYNTPYMFKKTMNKKKEDSKRASIKKEKNGDGDGFWTKVDIDKNTHPMGMPGVKLGSKEELNRSLGKNENNERAPIMKKIMNPVNESIDLSKRRFIIKEENETNGVNKRYIITKQLSAEEEKEKWARLAGFSLNESIRKAEDVIQECGCSDVDMDDDDKITRSEYEDMISREFAHNNEDEEESSEEMPEIDLDKDTDDVVSVEKPDSFVGYKFMKTDFMNENKYYILDLVTKQLVVNPNHISRRK